MTLPTFRYHNQRKTSQISNKMDIRVKRFEDLVIFVPQKGSAPPKRGTNWPQIGFSCFSGGDTQKSWAQSKIEAKRLKIARFRTDRTFWDPKLPHFHRPFFWQKLEICTLSHFRHRYAKSTCKIANVKNIRIRSYETSYFWCPEKGVRTQKVPKSVPYGIF